MEGRDVHGEGSGGGGGEGGRDVDVEMWMPLKCFECGMCECGMVSCSKPKCHIPHTIHVTDLYKSLVGWMMIRGLGWIDICMVWMDGWMDGSKGWLMGH